MKNIYWAFRGSDAETEVGLQNRLLCKNNGREIDHLLFGHGRLRVFRHVRQIVNAVKNGVDGLGDVTVHLAQLHFFGFDLLRRDFATGRKKVKNDGTDAARMLAGGSIEHGLEADGICQICQLGNECFFSGLAEFKLQFELSPDIAGSRNLWAGSQVGRHEHAWIHRRDPSWDCVG
jgi:hypothetical protein